MTDLEIQKIVEKYPVMTKEEEAKIFNDNKDNFDYLAELFFKTNILFYIKCTHSYYNRLDIGERISFIYQAVRKALPNYNPQYSRFTTYSRLYVRRELRVYFDRLDKKDSMTVSMNAPSSEDGSEFGDMLASPEAEEDYTWNGISINEVLDTCGNYLTPTENEYFQLWARGMDQGDISKKFNVSTQMTSAMIKRAIAKVRYRYGCESTERIIVHKRR